MMKRTVAWLMAILIIFQILPAGAQGNSSDWYQVISDEVDTPAFHAVRFMAEGNETAVVYVADGGVIDQVPKAPEVSGKRFLGWYRNNVRLNPDTPITEDLEYNAIYTELDQSLEELKLNADFLFEESGTYANISIFGTHKKNQKPTAGRNNAVTGGKVLEAWTANNIKNNTSLKLEAVITAVPEEGSLSAYTVIDSTIVNKVGENLLPGDRVVFDLSMKGAKGIALVQETDSEEEDVNLVDGALYANEHLYLTGKIPGNGIIEVTPMRPGIADEEVIVAYDIKIYANANQQKRGKTWQPAGDKVQVHFYNDAFTGKLNVYHIDGGDPEYLTTVDAQDGWVEFEAESFSIYAITRSIEKTVTIDGNTYKITVTYDAKAEIPDDAELDVQEVDPDAYMEGTADALGWSEEDEVFYTKFLNISIVKDGEEIEPKTPVTVTVELLDVLDGAEALEVVHFSDDGLLVDKVNSSADENGVVTFSTDSFSVFGFGSILRSLLSWTGEAVSYTIQGFSTLLNPTYETISVTLEEGLEAVNAYSVHSTLGSLLNMLYVKVTTALDLGNRESVVVYGVKNGEISDILSEGTNINARLALGDAEGFAVVKDTGYRRKILGLGDVELNGMLPKDAEAEAVDVTAAYEGFEFTSGEESTTDDPGTTEEEEPRVVAAYDISILEGDEDYQPDAEHPVSVSISSDAFYSVERFAIWHVHDDGTVESVTDFTVEDGTISFTATGFSVYVVVEAPDPVSLGETAETIYDLTGNRSIGGFYMSVTQGMTNIDFYFTSTLNGNSALIETTDISAGAVWHFEPVEGYSNRFYIYTLVGNERKYIKQVSANNNNITLSGAETIFEISETGTRTFYIKHAAENRWLQHSKGGSGIRFWTDNKDAGNSRIKLTYVTPADVINDPYDLDGKTYGIMNRKNDTSAYAMMSTEKRVNGVNGLSEESMFIRTDPMNQSNILYVAKDSDITMWTFHAIEEDLYYLTTEGKYLRIESNGAVTLVDEPDDFCRILVTPGAGDKKGKIRLLGEAANKAIYFYLKNNNMGFNAKLDVNGNEWHNLVEYSVYSESDFVQYTAHKVSVSDGVNVANGKQVVIYTRVWNDEDKKYEFYAIDHNGDLLPCYESGDSIVWIGTQINTVLWEFTEYYTPGTTAQNGYYELQNTYTGKYVAPQITDGQIFKNGTVGINLNGRYYGDYFTSILSWDDSHYDYAGYKVENGKIVSCPMAQAETFYFAVMNLTEHELTPVATVNHAAAGLTMKMVDCPSQVYMSNILGNNDGGMGTTLHQGLLSSGISGNPSGYPTTSTGVSLGSLYSGATEVNHLFIKSVYDGSGYYQFDSSENFAQLDGSTFTVYQELGTVGGVGETRKHGQFMPYNTLTGNVHPVHPYNLTDIYGHTLSDNYPRKYESLYAFAEPENHHFAMELTGHFMQTPNGHDAWGHDIIFEFVGDDDFWLYVDGELVIDLGGIHSAVPGSVNYSTGDVYVNGTHTTLKDLFYQNYKGRNHTDAEAQAYVDSLFQKKTVNGKTCYTFNDYSAHTIRIFYMERGAGASNLRMRFNLATVTPGQVLLTKEVTGTVKQDFASFRFPFQIYNKAEENEEYQLLSQELTSGVSSQWRVVYNNTSTKVDYDESVTINGVAYDKVFYLKPGQTAAIKVPDNTISYYIKECGVDNTIYDHVYVNGDEIEGVTPEGATTTKTFESSPATVSERARVTFSNHVNPSQLRTLTITKRLFDAEGTEITARQDNAGFTIRLRLGEELAYYNQGDYFVKDPSGNYCRFDSATQKFASIGVSDYDSLTEEQLLQVTFRTSPSGAASKLPAGYNIEVRGLLVGTRFKVDEEDYDIPVGYGKRTWTEGSTTYYGYKRVEGSYLVDEGDTQNAGVIRDNSNPKIEVHNQRGWGIRANKVWSDADFILSHDDVYFAVYVKEQLLEGSVRRIDAYNYTTYFFPVLAENASFSDYKVYEVWLENPEIGTDGTVTYSSIQKLEPTDTFTISGKKADGTEEANLSYAPSYVQGSETAIAGSNGAVRTDTVTNTRVGGLRIVKTDSNNQPLSGAVFTLKKGETLFGTYTSAEDGMVTTAYLEDGAYTLTETKAPSGYQALASAVSISVSNGSYTVQGDGDYHYDSDARILTMKNAPYTLAFRKVDANDESISLENAHFALYRQVKTAGGQLRKDYYPMEGYEDLVSGADGIIPGIDQTLAAGSYYLTETQAPEGYELSTPVDEVLFTISEAGQISVQSGSGYIGRIRKMGTDYTILIPNGKTPDAELTIQKIISGGMGNLTQQFTFTLNSVEDEASNTSYPCVKTAADGTETPGTIATGGTFSLAHNESVTITLPKNKDISISEQNGIYTTQWSKGETPIDSTAATGSSTVTITLEDNTEISVENHLDPVAPTGITSRTLPYVLMLAMAVILLSVTAYGKKRKKEEK